MSKNLTQIRVSSGQCQQIEDKALFLLALLPISKKSCHFSRLKTKRNQFEIPSGQVEKNCTTHTNNFLSKSLTAISQTNFFKSYEPCDTKICCVFFRGKTTTPFVKNFQISPAICVHSTVVRALVSLEIGYGFACEINTLSKIDNNWNKIIDLELKKCCFNYGT